MTVFLGYDLSKATHNKMIYDFTKSRIEVFGATKYIIVANINYWLFVEIIDY